jgi:hypothetical protein
LHKKTTKSRFELTSGNANASNSRSKVSKRRYRGSSGVRSQIKKNKRSWAKLEAKSEVTLGKILLDLPIRTKSEANCFEPWRLKYARHKQQQRTVALALNPLRGLIKLPCHIMLTRFAPDELDSFDNLPMSFKYIVDAVCATITGNYVAGKGDSDKRISIACSQIKSKEYGIRIEITY